MLRTSPDYNGPTDHNKILGQSYFCGVPKGPLKDEIVREPRKRDLEILSPLENVDTGYSTHPDHKSRGKMFLSFTSGSLPTLTGS